MLRALLYFLYFGCVQSILKNCWTSQSQIEGIKSPLCKNNLTPPEFLGSHEYFSKSSWPNTPVGVFPSSDKGDDCGFENAPFEEISGRIVCGQVTLPHRFPWMAAIYRGNNFACGSSIISKSWILTAAHCVESIHELQVIVGVHDLEEFENFVIEPKNVVLHPQYSTTTFNNDIALLELSHPLVFNETVQAICLIDAGIPDSDLLGYNTTVTGWGQTASDSQNHSRVLNYARGGKVISNDKCKEYYDNESVYSGIICTDTSDGVGVCKGDSGGPLMIQTISGQYEQIGVVSFGQRSCSIDSPQAFTRITHFFEWIKTETSL